MAKKQLAVITEVDLLEVLTQRAHLADLRRQVREAEACLSQKEELVMGLLRAGAFIEGHRTAIIDRTLGPSRPKYQELWVAHMTQFHGITEAMAMEVAKTKYPPKWVESLVISEAYPGILNKQQGRA